MFFGLTKKLIRISGVGLTLSVCALAQCPVDSIVVKGRIENANPHSTVRVQLVFPKHKLRESPARRRWRTERSRFQSNS